MAEVFLSDAWWRLAEEPASEDSSGGSAVVNLRVERGPEGEKRAYFTGRRLVSGHSGAAVATVTLPFTVAHAVFVEGKLQDPMSACAAGRIRVEGSMAGLGAIAGTDDVGPLRERLRGITAPLGDGPSLTGVAARQQQATAAVERLGLGDYARELDTQGYAIVPREVTGMDVGFIERVYGRVLDLMEEESGVRPDVETGETHRDVYYPSLYYCLFKDRMIPVQAPRGTLVVWSGGTWHGSLPAKRPGLRAGLAHVLTRPWLMRQQPHGEDVTERMLARNGPRFAVLMGQNYIAGYRSEGPQVLMTRRAAAAAKRVREAADA